MSNLLTYIFWPNPGNADYGSPKSLALIVICLLLVIASLVISRWRKRRSDQVLRRLSSSWSTASLWFGLVGLVLVVARVEEIQYIAMRLWWIVWGLLLALYVVLQIRRYRTRYYQVLPAQSVNDPRDKYLPKRKRR